MRLIVLTLALGLCAAGHGQNFATVYVTPPTSGCNGVWGVQVVSFYCGTAPYTFTMQPPGCIQLTGWTNNQSTLLLPLCAVPCSLTVTNADGGNCSGSTSDPTIGIDENATGAFALTLTGNILTITSAVPQAQHSARIVDPSGRLHYEATLAAGSNWQLPAPAASGMYTLVVSGPGASTSHPFIIVR